MAVYRGKPPDLPVYTPPKPISERAFYRQHIKLIISLILLTGMALIAFYWQYRLYDSVYHYRSILAGVTQTAEEALPVQSEHVVVVIISGLSDALSYQLELETLERLRNAGASAVVVGQAPSYDQPAWLSMISGASPDFNDAAPLNMPSAEIRPISVNSIIHGAVREDLNIALAGHRWWEALIPPELLTESYFTAANTTIGETEILTQTANWVGNPDLNLIMVQFNQLNAIALAQGPESTAYEEAALALDARLGALARLIDLSRTTLIITADHGHIEPGGYGGADVAVIETPLIMVGKGIVPGTYSPIQQVDLAPTLAALLGLNIPALTQGRPALEMLDITNVDEISQINIALARQRIFFMQAYLARLNQPWPDVAEFNQIRQFWAIGNKEGAAQLAQIMIEEADEAILLAQNKVQAYPRLARALVIVGLLIGLVFFVMWQHTPLWGEAFIGATIVLISYHLIYRISSLPYSLSAMESLGQLWFSSAWRIGLSLFIGSVGFTFLLLLEEVKDAEMIFKGAYELVILALIGIFLPALSGFWEYGFQPTTFLPNMGAFYLHLSALIQGFWAIVFGVCLPVFILVSTVILQKSQSFYQQRQASKLADRTHRHISS